MYAAIVRSNQVLLLCHLCDLALCLKDEMRCWAAPAGVAALNEGHDASDRCEQGPFIK